MLWRAGPGRLSDTEVYCTVLQNHLKNIAVSAVYMTVIVPKLQLAITILQHMYPSLQSIGAFSAMVKSVFLCQSEQDFSLFCICLAKGDEIQEG